MIEIFDSLFVFISTLVVIILLGLFASFSPILYIAQASSGSRRKKALHNAIAIMAGVIAALLLLNLLFQIINLDILLRFIDTTIRAIIISVLFNVLFGALLIALGVWYLKKGSATDETSPEEKKRINAHTSALFSLGFARTMLSVSGLTGTYLAGNTIAALSIGWVEQMVYTLIFLAAAVAPFLAIWILIQRGALSYLNVLERAQMYLKNINYRTTLGYTAIIFGSAVIVLNITIGLIY